MSDEKKPKQMPSGQVKQENYEEGGIDLKNTLSETGPTLGLGIKAGKCGEVKNLGMTQTDYTKMSNGGSSGD